LILWLAWFVFFLNKVADTIRLFISEIGSKPNRDWTIEYDGDLKEDFMKELHKESKKDPVVPSGGRILWRWTEREKQILLR
jgi:hypothetical protein